MGRDVKGVLIVGLVLGLAAVSSTGSLLGFLIAFGFVSAAIEVLKKE